MNLKNLYSIACACFLLLTCSANANVANNDNASISSNRLAYARASSLVSQFPSDLKPQIAEIDRINEGDCITLRTNKLIASEAGKYFITATVQVGVTTLAPPGHVDLWLIKNGTAIETTRTRIYVQNILGLSPLISQAILSLGKNDSVSVGYSSSSTNIGLIASTAPMIPSLTLSMFQVN